MEKIKIQLFEESAEINREKGTNRSQFFRGNKYKKNFVYIGSSK